MILDNLEDQEQIILHHKQESRLSNCASYSEKKQEVKLITIKDIPYCMTHRFFFLQMFTISHRSGVQVPLSSVAKALISCPCTSK